METEDRTRHDGIQPAEQAPRSPGVTAGPPECDCHAWYNTTVIGDWVQGHTLKDMVAVRVLAADPGIWTPPRCELPREILTARILAAGGISHEHALTARTWLDGTIELSNGVHRWSVAAGLGVRRIPIEADWERDQPDPWAYAF
jgi:hypothetical protein